MKNLLLPFTAIIWNLIIYMALYLTIWGFVHACSINILWMIITVPVTVGLLSILANIIPAIVSKLFLEKLYRYNWASVIIHSLSGILAVCCFFYLYNDFGFSFSDMSYKWLKWILLGLPFIGIFLTVINIGVVMPIAEKQLRIKEQKFQEWKNQDSFTWEEKKQINENYKEVISEFYYPKESKAKIVITSSISQENQERIAKISTEDKAK